MEFYDVIETRRSVRSFASADIPDDVLLRVLDAARIAPSGNNRQPWRFVVVKERAKKEAIARACYGQDFVAEAPVVVVCCSIRCASGYDPWGDQAGPRDVVIAADHLILAARSEGLGTCWVGAIHDEDVKQIVNASDDVDVVMVIPIGYPDSESAFGKPAGRKPLNEICFVEEYGRQA